MWWTRLGVVFCCIMLLAGTGLAAEFGANDDTYTLGEVVVTGEKTSVADIAITQTLTAEDILKFNSDTVADALKFAPGVVVTRGRKNEPEISVHGFGQEKTLFLIDGIPYYETYYGKLNLDQIPADIISKIDITKNAPSVLYGPNAQVAVINIVTRQGTEDPTFKAKADIGQDDTYTASLSHGNQVGAINYWLSYNHQESDGWKLSDDFDPEVATRMRNWMPDRDGIHEDGGRRENSDYEEDRFWARVGVTPTPDSEYFVSFHTLQSEKGHPFATDVYRIFPRSGDDPAFSTFARFEQYNDWGLDLSGRQALGDNFTLRGKLFYHDHEDEYVSYDGPDLDTVISKSTYEDNIFGVSLFADFAGAEWHTGHVSLHYKKDSHDDRADSYLPFNEYVSYTGSLGTEHEFQAGEALRIYAGVSYDWFDVEDAEDYTFDGSDNFTGQADMDTPSTDDEVNPMIGFDYLLGETTLYGSVARKTRFPSLFQLYSSSGGNPDLSSEQTVNYTLGVRQQVNDWMTADISGFYHDISDWISRDYYTASYTGDEIYTNTEEIAMTGVEVGLALSPMEFLEFNINYTYNRAKNQSSGRATDEVPGVPDQKLGVGCGITIPKVLVKLDLQGIYVDEMYEDLPTTGDPTADATKTDDYFILNGRLAKTFGDTVTCYAEVDNLFDKDYEQEIGFPGRGLNWRVGVSADF